MSKLWIFLTFLSFSFALYEDQVGKIDWVQNYIGKTEKTVSHTKYLISSSKGNVISVIDSSNGKLVWRHSFEEHTKINDLVVCGKVAISLSSYGGLLRLWDIPTGFIVSEHSTAEEFIQNGKLFCLDDKVFYSHSKGNGNLVLEYGDYSIEKVEKSFSKIHTCYLDSFKQVILGSLSGNDCSLLKDKAISEVKDVCKYSQFNGEFAFSIEGKSLRMHNLRKQTGFTLDLPSGKNFKIGQFSQNTFTIEDSYSIHVYATKDDVAKSLGSVDKFDHHVIASYDGNEYLVTLSHDMSKSFKNTQLALYSLMTGLEKLFETQTHISSHHGQVTEIMAIIDVSTFGRIEDLLKVVVKCSDYSIAAYNIQGKKSWIREEALGHVVSAEFVDLPVSEIQAFIEDEFSLNANIFEMFLARLKAQYNQLLLSIKNYFNIMMGNLNEEKPAHKSNRNEQEYYSYPDEVTDLKLSRDNFNLYKILVIVTDIGKVYGIQSQTGRLVWTFKVPNAGPLPDSGEAKIFNQRTSSHHTVPPITTVLMYSQVNDKRLLISFNPITGRPVDFEGPNGSESNDNVMIPVYEVPYRPIQMMMYPGMVGASNTNRTNNKDAIFKDTQYIKPLVLLASDMNVYIYPRKASRILKDNHHIYGPLFLYTINKDSCDVIGYRVLMSKIHQNANGQHYKAKKVWNLNLSSSGDPQVVVSSSAKIPHEKVHSIGRVLADRTVLYKYLNPNLIAVITRSKEESIKDLPLSQNTNQNMTVYLIDAVVGSILHSAHHPKTGNPLSILISENWIIYSFYNFKTLRTELVLLELFEQKSRSDQLDTWALFVRALTQSHSNRENQTLIQTSTSEGRIDNDNEERLESIEAYDNLDPFTFSSIHRDTSGRKLSEDGKTSEAMQSLMPVVLSKAYLISTILRDNSFAVSLTEKGITSKSIIMAMKNGGLIEVPLSWLDPSINMEMSPEAIADVYQPEIPLTTLNYINYNQTLTEVRKIKTVPSGLESTSLVFSYGMDLFHTRIAPSKTFDLLKEDFDYFFISAVTLGMLVGSFIAYRLATRKTVMKAWS